MRRAILGASFISLLSCSVLAQVPLSEPGCNLSAMSIVRDSSAFSYCLQPSVLKSDFDNFSLASAGLALFPGNPTAIAAARAWYDQVVFDLLHGASAPGAPMDIATWSLNRNAGYTGGTPGWVNGGLRITDNVGSGVTAFEWSITGIVNSYSRVSESVGVYGQGNNYSTGTTWGLVGQSYANVSNGTAVGLEIDAGGIDTTTNPVGIDIVDTGNMRAAIRVQPGVCALASAANPKTCIMFNAAGGIDIVVRGAKVMSY